MSKLIKVEGHEALCRDAQSNGIVNTDLVGLAAARQAKRKIIESQDKIDKLERRLDKLELLLQSMIGE